MRLTWTFVSHEARTQWRSLRFRVLSLVYLVIVVAPAFVPYVLARQGRVVVGPATFSGAVDLLQPVLTFLFAAVLAIDAVSRERDEGSLAVLGIAALSNAGYVLRRWIAVVAIILPVTIAPRLIAAGLAWSASRQTSAAFALGWVVSALPQLIAASAFGIALGTITGRTILAVLAFGAIFTMGMEIVNDLLVHVHRHFAGIGDFAGITFTIQRAEWILYAFRGYVRLQTPTEAGIDFRSELMLLAAMAAIPFAIAAILLAIAPAFLRRSRPDLRPWTIREDHPLKTFLRMLNRLREEYWPDPAPSVSDWLTVAIGTAIAVVLVVLACRRNDRFERRAEEAYQALTAPPPQTTAVAVVPVAVQIRGRVDVDGEVQSSSALTLRNTGARPELHFAFSINPYLTVDRVSSAGKIRVSRIWDRLLIDIDPPLAPGSSQTLGFDLHGTPGKSSFESDSFFLSHYGAHREGKLAIDMIDFARTNFKSASSPIRAELRARDLTPVPRYTGWDVENDGGGKRIADEEVTPLAAIDVALDMPGREMSADSCGTFGNSTFRSRCSFPLEQYLVFAARLKTIPLAGNARFAYFPLHEEAARMHAVAFNEAIATAYSTWPGLDQSKAIIVVERPRFEDEYGWYNYDYAPVAARSIMSSGAMQFVPESMIAGKRPADSGMIAASMIANSLAARRRMVPRQQRFFTNFAFWTAVARTGRRRGDAVVSGLGVPDTVPILLQSWGHDRLNKVLHDIEYRVGPDRLIQGINDFVGQRPDGGTARELLRAIGNRGGVSLERMYDDFFEGKALPQLTLDGVSFRHEGQRWMVTGNVTNRGTGEAVCPVVLRTAFEPLRRVVRVDSGQSVPFTFDSPAEPRTLQLDPERVCYRQAAVGLVDNVEYRSDR